MRLFECAFCDDDEHGAEIAKAEEDIGARWLVQVGGSVLSNGIMVNGCAHVGQSIQYFNFHLKAVSSEKRPLPVNSL